MHSAIRFRQIDFLRSYIEFNTSFRAVAKNEFVKTVCKLANNVIYGKSIENVRKRRDIVLVTTRE